MARPLRINLEDGIYHVTSRGLEKRQIVHDDTDRRRWVRLLGQVAQRREWRVLAWALMNNHFHLFVRTPHADISAGMHDLNSGYVTLFNHRHERVGPLLQGRFGAVIVERDYHYWELSRYIHLNPVRAGLADRPDIYPWSSCPSFFRSDLAPAWLAWEEVLRLHGRTVRSAREEYMRYLLDGAASGAPAPLREAVAGTVYGSASFVDRMAAWLKGRPLDRNVPAAKALRKSIAPADIARATAAEFGVNEREMLVPGKHANDARKAAIFLTKTLTPLRLEIIGEFFGGIKGPAVCNIAAWVATEKEKNRQLGSCLSRIEGTLAKNEE